MPFCSTCGYDLAAHSEGDRCPECGESIESPLAVPPPKPHWAVIGITLTCLFAALLFSTYGRMLFIYLWIATEVLAIVVVAASAVQIARSRCTGFWWSFAAAAAALVIPTATLILFMRVFIIGGASNVAQMAGSRGDLWSLWYDVWPTLSCGNLISLILVGVSAVLPPRDARYCGAWAVPAAVLLAVITAAVITSIHFPDA